MVNLHSYQEQEIWNLSSTALKGENFRHGGVKIFETWADHRGIERTCLLNSGNPLPFLLCLSSRYLLFRQKLFLEEMNGIREEISSSWCLSLTQNIWLPSWLFHNESHPLITSVFAHRAASALLLDVDWWPRIIRCSRKASSTKERSNI